MTSRRHDLPTVRRDPVTRRVVVKPKTVRATKRIEDAEERKSEGAVTWITLVVAVVIVLGGIFYFALGHLSGGDVVAPNAAGGGGGGGGPPGMTVKKDVDDNVIPDVGPVKRRPPRDRSEDGFLSRKEPTRLARYKLLRPYYSQLPFKIQMQVAVLNFSAISAAYLDYRALYTPDPYEKAKAEEGAEYIRRNMNRLEKEMVDRMPTMLKVKGIKRGQPFYLKSTDLITEFGRCDLGDCVVEEAVLELGNFVSHIHAGVMVDVKFVREGVGYDLEISFSARPKEILAIVQVTGLVPGQDKILDTEVPRIGDESKVVRDGKVVKRSPFREAANILADLQRRQLDGYRRAALKEFRNVAVQGGHGADFAAASAIFLGRPEFMWRLEETSMKRLEAYFKEFPPKDARSWNAQMHVKAAEYLSGAIAALLKEEAPHGASLLEMFALAHVSEATALDGKEKDVARAADRVGFVRSKDRKVWGRPRDVALYDMASLKGESIEKIKAGIGPHRHSQDFALRYVATYFDILVLIRERKSLKKTHEGLQKWLKNLDGQAKRHLDVIADSVASVGRCLSCTDGMGKCATCKGGGKYDKPCSTCDGDGKLERYPGRPKSPYYACRKCRGTGIIQKDANCRKCGGTGKAKCSSYRGGGWSKELDKSVAAMSFICTEEICARCGGRRTALRHAMLPCDLCGGFGLRIAPSRSPSTKLDFSKLK
ncbi:MAG: DnaJ-like cysteine-rich domain-containing protein [Planctomycetota bacterium]|jgi:hypothetical protein